ncbi:MAG: MMPL family transporter [Nocardioides sp.]|uniref:MMPL family transporter n=1 Tax=Nocardioides sp. TaxID=35761 RepID=UPI0039E279F1
MFGALGRLAARRPWYVIGAWIVVMILLSVFAPSAKSTNDQADFLPGHYESIKATNLMDEAFPDVTSPGATIVYERSDGGTLSAADRTAIDRISKDLQPELGSAFGKIAATEVSSTKKAAAVNIALADGVTGEKQSDLDQVKTLRDDLETELKGTDLVSGVTGTLAKYYDQSQSGSNAEAIVGIATVLLILVLLGVIFRSVLIALMPILLVGVILTPVSNKLIGIVSHLFDLQTDDSTSVILIVVLFGIGTDYILFFLFRYRERMREGEEHRAAIAHAVERAGEAIASAGGAVFVAFMTLVLSTLGIFRSIGPSLAIAVAVTVIAALTLVPAVACVLGRALFWPSKKWRTEPKAARFEAIGRSLGAHPVRYAVASGGVLAILAVFSFAFGGFNPNFDLQSSSSSTNVESAKADQMLVEGGFDLGQTDPTPVVLHATDGRTLTAAEVKTFAAQVGTVEGVGTVSGTTIAPKDPSTAVVMTVLTDDPSSDAAIDVVRSDLRPGAHAAAPSGTEAYVGGTASVFVDFQSAMNRDYAVVFPVAAAIILIILMLVLRSLVAPWYLMASVGLGFGATLGATVIVFQHVKGDAGLIFLLPIYIYLFVVALGTDYNILMVTRLREEAREGRGPRDAAAQAVKHGGPTVAAAGVILAGTFASLMLAGNSLLTTMGFAIAFGIAAAAFVMAMFFTPALTALVGKRAWWPGHGADAVEPAETSEPDVDQVGAGDPGRRD